MKPVYHLHVESKLQWPPSHKAMENLVFIEAWPTLTETLKTVVYDMVSVILTLRYVTLYPHICPSPDRDVNN